MLPPFEYRKLGDFTYHILTDPAIIKQHLLTWIMREWQADHAEAPDEPWTVEWMHALPGMDFTLEVVALEDIHPRPDLMSVDAFRASLQERADEREEAMLRGVSIEPLLVNRAGFELMDGYTRHAVLQRYGQRQVHAYVGTLRT